MSQTRGSIFYSGNVKRPTWELGSLWAWGVREKLRRSSPRPLTGSVGRREDAGMLAGKPSLGQFP